ncbi:MAG: hypothetical protein WCA22_18750 [Candidatus Binatus sp.]
MSQPDMSENGKELTASKHASTGLYVRASAGYRLRDKKTERLARKVRSVLTWLEPSDYPAVRAWAELEVLATQVFAVLRAGSVVNAAGDGKRLLDDYRKLRLAQAVYSRELGMTPASRMAIKATGSRTAFDLPGAIAATAEDAETVETGGKEVKAAERAQRAQEIKPDE